MSDTSPRKSRKTGPTDALRVDIRAPFAFCAAEALLLLALLALLIYLHIPYLEWIALGAVVFYLVTAGTVLLSYVLRCKRLREAEETAEQLNTDIYRMFRTVVDIPYAVVNSDGVVRVTNSAMQNILAFRSPLCSIPLKEVCPELSMEQIAANAQSPRDVTGEQPICEREGRNTGHAMLVRLDDNRRYRVESYLLRRRSEHYYFLIFRDISDYLDLVDRTNRSHMVLAYIVLDNLQELTQFVRANYRETANRIEKELSKWVSGMSGMIREYDRDKYLALFSSEKLDECIREDFPILNRIMNIRVGDNSFPVSVSMGIADIDGTMQEREEAANAALDMALQRGGNQVALQRRGVTGLTYYGGAHKTIESNTSISSRVSAHLLEKRLAVCDNVFLMAHANPDFDAIGSSVGMYRLCRSILKAQDREDIPVHIIANKTCDTFRICAEHLATLPEYDHVFIDKATAQQTVTTGTVLIVTDVSNPMIFEAPELVTCIPTVDGVSSIAVIDHHRLVGELPFVPFLHYIETTKSSASEIVAEILEQSDYANTLLKEEANLLLSGIMLDTHNFTRSAGAQTFEVTYYLYSRNAHTGIVREFFNERMDEMMIAGDFNAHTRIYADVFAITWLGEDHVPSPEDRIAGAKAADKLLSLRGVEASFSLVSVGGSIAVSARSKGRINVQIIMEKLDGGGHFDMAGTQLNGSMDHVCDLLCAAIDEYRQQFPELFKSEKER